MESDDLIESHLSDLCTETCADKFIGYVPLPAADYKIHFSVAVADAGILAGEFTDDGSIRFHLPVISIVISRPTSQEGMVNVHITGEAKFSNLEWNYVAQMRFLLGTDMSVTDRVVDGDLFELGKRCSPIVIRIGDENVRRVRIEIKFVETIHDFLPKFDYGDIALKFQSATLRVYKALLSLHSDYMAQKLKYAAEDAVVDMGDCSMEDFKELLYQIYPTKRPLWANLKGLAKAAVSYRADGIIDRITSYIVNYESMYMEQKITESIKLELSSVIEELVYKAEQDGFWADIVRNGLNPEVEYGPAIYHSIILPAIAKAKSSPVAVPARPKFFEKINFRKPPQDNSDDTAVMVVAGTKLYVNKGIMKVNNDTMFGRGNAGEMIVQLKWELIEECRRIKKTPLDVVEALLRHIYPHNEPIDAILLRAMLVLCSTHHMELAMNSLENYLIQEPPTSPERFLEQFELAEKYNLKNLLLRNLHRIENSCRHFAQQMIKLENFKKLKEQTQNQILDRYCSGWAVGGINPTKRLSRLLTLEGEVGNVLTERDKNLSTFMEVDSYAAFGTSEEID